MSRQNKDKRRKAEARVHSDRRVEARREEARRLLDQKNREESLRLQNLADKAFMEGTQ